MLIDSILIIYATQPPYTQLRSWLVNYATHYSAISRLETLGYHRLGDAEKQAIMAILDNLDVLMINKVTLEIAVALRQQQKMSVGDSLIAATCLDSDLPLATANIKDFDWIEGLLIHNPLELGS
ncbi:type II toxin-antitoxin system VapC family toxin [Cylindrospermopsis raciborskii]|uniref:Nucleic acid-binding protein n=1 Tax=Cylindrospermopsis raciborskii CENA302 TaxID=1170768 RepID=A0A9Q5QWW8_9CYAN|nr:type II toxin-antitoxin system VapC family toxin [Cylindrospermopsis raciborskii]NLQ05598.1 type II toxin-antitoxin system VapC family toxin [Cylindrospermopsis raciborskii MVCC19]OHY36438.1 nucleic acid-binding protein [Cylindrospermopsis raciborskii MVCC14]OPH09707.1 nucleic acid-binding protein [Cylindrospermopsis raciborskii CENA302]